MPVPIELRRPDSPWGRTVRVKLYEKGLMQYDLIEMLNQSGFNTKKATVTNLMKGLGSSAHLEEIKIINEYLGISEKDFATQ